MTHTIPGSRWGDCFVFGSNKIGCVYDLGHDVVVDFMSLKSGILVRTDTIIFAFDEPVLFARGDRNNLGHILVMGQGHDTGKFKIQSRGGNYAPLTPLVTAATNVCDLIPIHNSFHYVVHHSHLYMRGHPLIVHQSRAFHY